MKILLPLAMLSTIGTIAAIYFGGQWIYTVAWADSYTANAATEAVYLAKALERIRSNDIPGATALLEGTLDSNIIAASMHDPILEPYYSAYRHDRFTVKALLCKTASYRNNYPSPDSGIASHIANTLRTCK